LRFLADSLPEKKAARWAELADQVKESFLKYFPLKDEGYLSDCLHCKKGTPASKAEPDDHLRPNQLLAITLGLVEDPKLRRGILLNTSELLVPGGIRSLADRPVKYPLPIYGTDGKLLNDPQHPYQGHYCGDEDTRRKVAYHNGTAWTWQMPLFPEAYYITHGAFGRATAISLLSSMSVQLDNGCIMHMPEILDGDYPHKARGCDAQAWGLSEYYRVWKLLHPASKSVGK
ncbi:MAG: glycogen debranching protein, partial [Clostridia bacterium]|nr:glycogen debranching protein [Clostridia bacterium]